MTCYRQKYFNVPNSNVKYEYICTFYKHLSIKGVGNRITI